MSFSIRRTISPWRAWLFGAVTVGVLDLTDAFVFFGLRGATPIRILQSIASGLLGKDAFSGGMGTAALGVLCHFAIASGIVGTFMILSRWLPVLTTRPWLFGPAYGVVVYLVMNQVVVPLSHAANASKPLIVVINGLLIHMIGVGPPSVFAARRAGEACDR